MLKISSVKFATYYVVLYNYVLVRACVVCDFKDMTVCTHDGGLYSTVFSVHHTLGIEQVLPQIR
jgi:hypothetical protein